MGILEVFLIHIIFDVDKSEKAENFHRNLGVVQSSQSFLYMDTEVSNFLNETFDKIEHFSKVSRFNPVKLFLLLFIWDATPIPHI